MQLDIMQSPNDILFEVVSIPKSVFCIGHLNYMLILFFLNWGGRIVLNIRYFSNDPSSTDNLNG